MSLRLIQAPSQEYNLTLVPVTLKNLGPVWEFVIDRLESQDIDVDDCNIRESFDDWLYYVRVVMKKNEIYTVFYPEPERSNGHILTIHAILSEKAARRPKDQVLFLRMYTDYWFKQDTFSKIELETPSKYPLIQNIAERSGFTREGIRRQAWFDLNESYDVHQFGLLRSEWKEKPNGR